MKRLASLLLAMCLLMSVPALALVPEEVPGQLRQMVEEYLIARELEYEVMDNENFKLIFNLESSMGTCNVYIYAYEDMLRVSVFSPVKVPKGSRDKVAALLVRINFRVNYGTFHMDYSDGEVSCYTQQYVESVLPGPQELGVILNQPILYLDAWADAINKVSLLGADPEEVYEEAAAELGY